MHVNGLEIIQNPLTNLVRIPPKSITIYQGQDNNSFQYNQYTGAIYQVWNEIYDVTKLLATKTGKFSLFSYF